MRSKSDFQLPLWMKNQKDLRAWGPADPGKDSCTEHSSFKGIRVFAVIAPILPGADGLIIKLPGKVDHILIDRLFVTDKNLETNLNDILWQATASGRAAVLWEQEFRGSLQLEEFPENTSDPLNRVDSRYGLMFFYRKGPGSSASSGFHNVFWNRRKGEMVCIFSLSMVVDEFVNCRLGANFIVFSLGWADHIHGFWFNIKNGGFSNHQTLILPA